MTTKKSPGGRQPGVPDLHPVKGVATEARDKKNREGYIQVLFLPDETGYAVRMVLPDDFLPRRLVRAVYTTIPEHALGSLED